MHIQRQQQHMQSLCVSYRIGALGACQSRSPHGELEHAMLENAEAQHVCYSHFRCALMKHERRDPQQVPLLQSAA